MSLPILKEDTWWLRMPQNPEQSGKLSQLAGGLTTGPSLEEVAQADGMKDLQSWPLLGSLTPSCNRLAALPLLQPEHWLLLLLLFLNVPLSCCCLLTLQSLCRHHSPGVFFNSLSWGKPFLWALET